MALAHAKRHVKQAMSTQAPVPSTEHEDEIMDALASDVVFAITAYVESHGMTWRVLPGKEAGDVEIFMIVPDVLPPLSDDRLLDYWMGGVAQRVKTTLLERRGWTMTVVTDPASRAVKIGCTRRLKDLGVTER